jgi:hypothetical protein
MLVLPLGDVVVNLDSYNTYQRLGGLNNGHFFLILEATHLRASVCRIDFF